MSTVDRGEILTRWARGRLRQALGGPEAHPPQGDWCALPAATFVTLRWRDGKLQGCIGSLEPKRPLVEDVAHNVVAAAMFDPRAEPVTLRDIEDLKVEVSVLSPLEPIAFEDEASALAALRVGTDGVVFQWKRRRSTFLPIMWKELPTPEVFMSALKMKAGLAPDFWGADVKLWRYSVDRHEDGPS